MIYDIRHVTTYAYESPVSFARCSLRLEPRCGDGQQLVSHGVEIRPRPADRSSRRDFFGTLTENVVIETAHRHLRIDSRSRVTVSRKADSTKVQVIMKVRASRHSPLATTRMTSGSYS